jgi:hypothetical protein
MVERPVLEEGHVEFIGDQGSADVPGEARMALERRQIALPPPSSATA